MDDTWVNVEVYSEALRIRGQIQVLPGSRLSDEVNRLERFMTVYNSVTEPLVSSHPVASPQEASSSIAKSAILMVVPDADTIDQEANRALWREKVRHQVVINTSALAMTAEIHLEPRVTLGQQLEHGGGEFLPLTRVNAIVVPSLGNGSPRTFQRQFALVNPQAIVSYTIRPAAVERAAV